MGPDIVSLPNAETLEREAASWFVRLDGGDVPDSDLRAFREWISQSQQHKDAFDRMAALWEGAGILDELGDLAAADDMPGLLRRNESVRRSQTAKRMLVGAAAASILAVLGVTFINMDRDYTGQYSTVVGEQKTIDLPDGSTVVLNTDSAFDVAFKDGIRRIHLSKGEAFFEVAPDSSKPFSVATSNGVVTAVGTAFAVRVHEDKIDVLVTEGRVTLVAAQKNNDAGLQETPPVATEVSAGQFVEFAQLPKAIELVEGAVAEKALDWQDGVISFNGETLEQVITDLSRYTDIAIEIADEELRHKQIVAYYRVGEIEPMFDALRIMAKVEVERVSDQHVRLYRLD